MDYSETLVKHFRQPVTVTERSGEPYQAAIRVGDPRRGGVIDLQLRIDERGVISGAGFRAYGCGVTIAAASWVCDWLPRRSLDEAATLHDTTVSAALALPPSKLHCAVLATAAVRMAVADYRAKATVHDDAGE